MCNLVMNKSAYKKSYITYWTDRLFQAKLKNLLKQSGHNCFLTKSEFTSSPILLTKSSCIGLK